MIESIKCEIMKAMQGKADSERDGEEIKKKQQTEAKCARDVLI